MKKQTSVLVKILICIFAVVLLAPFVYGTLQAFPVLDDFDYAIGCWTRIRGRASAVSDAFAFANEQYMTWSGTWLLIFFENLLSPLHYGEPDSRIYGVFVLITFVFFVGAFIWSMYTIVSEICFRHKEEFINDRFGDLRQIGNVMGRRIQNGSGYMRTNKSETGLFYVNSKTAVFIVVLLSLAALLMGYSYPETMTMFNGSMQYRVSGAFALLSIAFMARFFGDDYYSNGGSTHERDGVFMCVCGVLACVQLSWCIPVGLAYLVFFARDYWSEDGLRFSRLVPLGLFIVTGCTVAFAPGQKARALSAGNASVAGAGSDGAFMTLLKGVWHATYAWGVRIKELFTNPFVLMFFILIFIAGMALANGRAKDADDLPVLIIRTISIIFMTWGVAFPACVGYGNSYLPSRMQFSVDLAIITGMTVLLFRTGQQIALIHNVKAFVSMRGLAYCIVILGFVLLSVVTKTYKDSPWFIQISQTKEIASEREFWTGFYNEVKEGKQTAKETGVVNIERFSTALRPTGIYVVPELTEDGSWPNNTIEKWIIDVDGAGVCFKWK